VTRRVRHCGDSPPENTAKDALVGKVVATLTYTHKLTNVFKMHLSKCDLYGLQGSTAMLFQHTNSNAAKGALVGKEVATSTHFISEL
jgi:hypothetical protein